MTNFYDVANGLSQDEPGPLEPVEIAQQPGAAPATGNTARDQEMYAAGIRTGEENTKHNAAIRAGAGWLPIESAPKDGRRVLLWNERYNAAITGQFYGLGGWKLDGEMPPLFHQPTHWMPLPAATGVSTVEDEEEPPQLPYVVQRILKFAGQNQRFVTLPNLSAQQAIDLAHWIQASCRPAPAAGDALDAARYRWLCDKFGITKLPCAIERIIEGSYVADGKAAIDAAIDTAIAAQRKGNA